MVLAVIHRIVAVPHRNATIRLDGDIAFLVDPFGLNKRSSMRSLVAAVLQAQKVLGASSHLHLLASLRRALYLDAFVSIESVAPADRCHTIANVLRLRVQTFRSNDN